MLTISLEHAIGVITTVHQLKYISKGLKEILTYLCVMEPVIGVPIEIQKVIDQINHMQTALPEGQRIVYYIDENGDVDCR